MNEAVSTGWVSFRDRAGDRKGLLGENFPTRKNEAWHYTRLQGLGKTEWKHPAPMSLDQAKAQLEALNLPQAAGQLVFGNGFEIPELSVLPKGVERLEAVPAPQRPEELPAELQECFSAHLNGALQQPGVQLQVPAGVAGGLLLLVSLHDGGEVSTHLRHALTLGEGASLQVLDVQTGQGIYLANPVMTVTCGPKSHLVHVKQQAESPEATHLGLMGVEVAQHALYDGFTLNQGSALGRHEVMCALEGPHARAHVNALQIVNGTRLNDLTSRIRHHAPDCISRQTVQSVLSDKGEGVFQGQILVERDAQKTDGEQLNQALLLSEGAQINSKPELKIYADDVKCSHGATVGALDEDQLFFLRARGIPEKKAHAMLVAAFLQESLHLVEDAGLQNYLAAGLLDEGEV